jgi:Family of unknown function (DUF6519)
MGIDVSKVRLNPFLDFAGVELKQGGVLIDADLNELGGIVDRRLRALASDVLGRARVSSTTPDAFKVSASGATFTIGKGRHYVDGLLAENHGAETTNTAKLLLDPLLAEAQFADAIAYDQQPYLPVAPTLPIAGRHLVYLDVWNREVTHLENPNLIEVAVGVEATSRVQTVWQVRALVPDAGAGTTCVTPDAGVPGWSDLTAPSTGRLTVGEHQVVPVDDPCELPPTGGYRGLENQLYRVEIHNGGQPGAGATFKWSRDNASIGSRVASIVSATVLELETLGRDDVLSLKTGDWVEITDDVREFSQAPGEMRKITVDPATRRITVAALPVAMLPTPANFPNAAFPKLRNTRVRRWDQGGKIFRTNGINPPVEIIDPAAANGLISVPATTVTLILEHGITVTFASTGAKGFKPGDYWVFAARTSDASIEKPVHAPPRGIQHHYARLGIWDVGAGTVTDCRNPWPPATGEGHDCSCTQCVTEASHADGSLTIQDAVNKASQTGGTVCIGVGQFALKEPVRLTGTRALTIRGQGAPTVLFAASGAFLLNACFSVKIESLAMVSFGNRPAIAVNTALGLTLREMLIAMLDLNGDTRSAAIALSGAVAATVIEDNGVFAHFGIRANDPSMLNEGQDEDDLFLLTGALAIEDNTFWCASQAVALEGRVVHIADTRISGNDVLDCRDAAISAFGLGIASSSAEITHNHLYVRGDGIAAALDGLWVGENKIVNINNDDTASGITLATGLFKTGIGPCQILANQIQGFGFAGIAIAAPVRNLIIKLNIIEDCANGIVTVGTPKIGSVSIENNQLRKIGANANQPNNVSIGIGITRAETAAIVGNVIRDLGMEAIQSPLRAGVMAFGVGRLRVAGNDIIALAPTGEFIGQTAGVLVLSPLGEYRVEQNRIERDFQLDMKSGGGPWAALLVGEARAQIGIARVGPFVGAQLAKGPRIMFTDGRAFLAAAGTFDDLDTRLQGVILGNTMIARSIEPAVEVIAAELQFSNNRVEAHLNQNEAVVLRTQILIMNANKVLGGEASVRIDFATMKSATILGNITTGVIAIPGFTDPWAMLNIRV